MPVHEKHYIAGDVSDLVSESAKDGIAGAAAGILVEAGGTAPDERPIGAYSGLEKPTGVSAADSVTASACDVSFTAPSGAAKCDIVVRVNATKEIVKKVDTTNTTSPETVTGLTAGTEYEFLVRGVASDGRVGPFAAAVTATPA